MSGLREEKMQIMKEILRSTIVTVSGPLIFLVLVAHILGLRAAILLLCGATVALVAGLIFQITDQESFLPLGHRIVNFYRALARIILNTLILVTCLEMTATFVARIWKAPVRVNDDGGENSPRPILPIMLLKHGQNSTGTNSV